MLQNIDGHMNLETTQNDKMQRHKDTCGRNTVIRCYALCPIVSSTFSSLLSYKQAKLNLCYAFSVNLLRG